VIKPTSSLLLTLVLSLQLAFGQSGERETVTQALQWLSLNSNIKMTSRLSWLVEGQFRYADSFDPQQYQARTALDIKINDRFSFVPLGYVYTWNYKYGKQPAVFENNEHRIWQQVFYKHNFRRFKIDHRLRFEERFIQQHHVRSDGAVVDDGYILNQTRLRYRLMARLPLNRSSIEPGTYFASVYDEIFFSWGEHVTYHKPDQNRLFAGAGYQLNKNLTLQGGLIYQLLVKSNGAKQENNVGVQFQVTYNVDCSKAGQ
jgi:outer membrane receptor protein involved in Fe transport